MSGTEHKHQHPDDEPAVGLAVVGLSAGGLLPLRQLVRALPLRFPGALVIAQHLAASDGLPALIAGWCGHHAVLAASGMTLCSGTIYVCPAQHHLIVNADATLTVSSKARIQYVRPSIDWLFQSAAAAYADRAVGVILSGANGDGTLGSIAIAEHGGITIAQDPATCAYPAMPRSAIQKGAVHSWATPAEIARALVQRLQNVQCAQPNAWSDAFAA